MRVLRVARDPVVAACLLGLLGVLVHLPAVRNDFVLDDIPAVVENPVVTGAVSGSRVVEAFRRNFWGGRPGYEHVVTWRPLTTLTFALDHAIGGAEPSLFHAVNLLLHGLVVALLSLLVRAWLRDPVAAVFAGGLFAVLPVHVEAVAGVVNRAELIAAACYLGGLAAYATSWRAERRDAWLGLALACFVLGLFAKEHTVTWPGAVLVLEGRRWLAFRRGQAERPRLPPTWMIAGVVAAVAVWLLGRHRILPSLLAGDVPIQDNPLAGPDVGFGTQLLMAFKLYANTLRLLAAPLHLSVDYGFDAIPLPSGPDADVFAGIVLFTLSCLALAWAVRRHLGVAACMALFVVTYGPVSQFAVLGTVLTAERLLYLPSVAWCIALGLAAAGAWRSTTHPAVPPLVLALALLVGLGYSVRSTQRTLDWRDAETLYSSSLRATPGSARCHHNLGVELLSRGRLDDAESHLDEAHRLVPHDHLTLSALGDVRWQRGDLHGALERYRASFRAAPSRAVLPGLCRALVVTEAFTEGEATCALAVTAFPALPMVHYFLGVAHWRVGHLKQAAEVMTRAVRLDPGNPVPGRDLRAIRRALEAATPPR